MLSFLFPEKHRRKRLKELKKHLRHILHVNDDIINRGIKDKLQKIISEAEEQKAENKEQTEEFLERAPLRAAKILPKQSLPTLREYLDILAVAVMVAFGVRALFLQPFKIPTSSMQPTLFGIHYAEKSAFSNLPDFLSLPFFGARNAELTVKADGYINPNSFNSFLEYLFLTSSKFQLGGINYQLPGKILQTDNNGEFDIKYYPMSLGVKYREGEKPADGWMVTGDHLFVDRFSHHFTPLKRGDVLVFNTKKIAENGHRMRGFYYIKRLIGIPGDKIRIKNNMVYISPENKLKETEVYKLAKSIKKIYSGKGGYHGHQNAGIMSESDSSITVPEDMYFVLGDNSARSYDSRYWGFVPRESVVGRGFFIFWPFSRRWGVVDSKEALDLPTNFTNIKETMNKQ